MDVGSVRTFGPGKRGPGRNLVLEAMEDDARNGTLLPDEFAGTADFNIPREIRNEAFR